MQKNTFIFITNLTNRVNDASTTQRHWKTKGEQKSLKLSIDVVISPKRSINVDNAKNIVKGNFATVCAWKTDKRKRKKRIVVLSTLS